MILKCWLACWLEFIDIASKPRLFLAEGVVSWLIIVIDSAVVGSRL